MRPKEIIPDESNLYRNLPKADYNENQRPTIVNRIPIQVFRDKQKKYVSFEWDRYAKPEDTLSRYGKKEDYKLLSIQKGNVRSIVIDPTEFLGIDFAKIIVNVNKPLSVEDEPLPKNDAHVGVHGIYKKGLPRSVQNGIRTHMALRSKIIRE